MHLKRISKDAVKMVIASLLIVFSILGSLTFYTNHKKIERLEHQLELKQQIESQKEVGYTHSTINIKTIKDELNKLQDYSILKDNKISMNHTYNYDKESFLGLHKKGTLTASANVVYDIDVRLSEARVYMDDRGKVNIELDSPFLDERSVHYESNSMIINEDKTNLLFNKDDGKDIMKYWINSFTTSAIDNLNEHYSSEYEQNKLKSIAKQQIKELVSTLGLDILDVRIIIND